MGSIVNDTSKAASDKQVELLGHAGPARRVQLALSLSDSVVSLARNAIAQAHPEMSDVERRLLFVEVHYGRDLARRVREYLAQHHHGV